MYFLAEKAGVFFGRASWGIFGRENWCIFWQSKLVYFLAEKAGVCTAYRVHEGGLKRFSARA